MKKCLNCGSTNVAIPSIMNSCRTSSCSNKVNYCTECGCTKSSYCPDCQEKLVKERDRAEKSELKSIGESIELEEKLELVKKKLKE